MNLPRIRFLERRIAQFLEHGSSSPWLRGLAQGWALYAAHRPRTPALPGVHLMGVEGATLGGSWRTPLALALTQELVRKGERVVFWSHGYGGRGPGRWVSPQEAPWEAGDEAVLAARTLEHLGVPVRVGAFGTWAGQGTVIVADGLRVSRGRGACALLALDGEAPWGAGRCPPAGDLRARPKDLLEAASEVIEVGEKEPDRLSIDRWRGRWRLEAEGLQGVPVAMVTAVGRPERFQRGLERAGVVVTTRVELPDHRGRGVAAEVEARLQGRRFDVVVCTEKCALWLPERLRGKPVVVVRGALDLPPGFVEAALQGSRWG
ncbi:MAG: tetraacyldisaccharide 4'-kinase [Myxococcales bacterium]|nr:tetraacyldisaccharide 4'-kinase [Polyangiaceae bacterium]MDW8250731.1 tetraacyldisaccharide 4'-kinase [Myxococcales bacterium]